MDKKMKVSVALFSLALLLVGSSHAFPANPKEDPISSIKGLISRILGQNYVDNFVCEVIADSQGYDVFEIDKDPQGKPVLRGNNGVALASAFNFYLKYWCNCSISWGRDGTGDQLNVPNPLPTPKTKERRVFPNRFRYYLNVCTVSYSMAWWDWKRWEREIDWMAMNGLNFILSFTGQEYLKQKFYRSLGVTDEEIKAFFAGPAFLAWQRMGNIKGWGGPLDDGWINKQWELQKMIVERQRLFGMVNILPGFAGHVPQAIQRLYPKANLTRSANWGRFGDDYSRDYFLHPSDPLFVTLGKSYYQMLLNEIGTDHYYNSDAFNEMEPASGDLKYLASTNAKTYEAMAAADPDAVYVMQGWLFRNGAAFWNQDRIKAYLSGVPDDKMIILDLSSEDYPVWSKTSSYFGKPFIWCLLHNYGGNRGIYGNLTTIANDPVEARNTPGSTMVGVGMTPEAIEHNPVVYDLMGEMSWRSENVDDVMSWLDGYITRRYGNWTYNTHKAWQLLSEGAYQFHWSNYARSIVSHQPGSNTLPDERFDAGKIAEAWRLIVTDTLIKSLNSSVGPLRYDIVDIGRQMLTDLFADLYTMIRSTYAQYSVTKDPSLTDDVQVIAGSMIEIIKDLEALLATDTNFLLGNWISEARASAAPNSSEKVVNNLEFNARNQITMWGPNHNIEDYADKQWSGMFGDYYLNRWEMYTTALIDAMKKNQTFDSQDFQNKLYQFESDWNHEVTSYPTQTQGDTIEVAKQLLGKYYKGRDYLLKNYDILIDQDIVGSNLYGQGLSLWTKMSEQIVWLCEMHPKCVGFSFPQLYFKSSRANTTFSPGNILYVKKSSG